MGAIKKVTDVVSFDDSDNTCIEGCDGNWANDNTQLVYDELADSREQSNGDKWHE